MKTNKSLKDLPRHIIKDGHFFVNSHTGARIHESRITDWLPKAEPSPAQHEVVMSKRWDLCE